jgi:hypothetical protein
LYKEAEENNKNFFEIGERIHVSIVFYRYFGKADSLLVVLGEIINDYTKIK